MYIIRVSHIGFCCFRTRTDDHAACRMEPDIAPNDRAELTASRRTFSCGISLTDAEILAVVSSVAAARPTRETLPPAPRNASPSLRRMPQRHNCPAPPNASPSSGQTLHSQHSILRAFAASARGARGSFCGTAPSFFRPSSDNT